MTMDEKELTVLEVFQNHEERLKELERYSTELHDFLVNLSKVEE